MADGIISMAERLAATYQEQVPNGGGEEEFVTFSGTLKAMREVLDDADNRRFKEKSVNDWLSWLEQTSYEMEDVLDRWDYYIHHLQRKTVLLMSDVADKTDHQKEAGITYDIAKKILTVKAQLDRILEKKDIYSIGIRHPTTSCHQPKRSHYSTSLVDSKQVHGRDSDKDILVTKLTAKDMAVDGGDGINIQVLSITGMPGIGKTTLAQLVYNDSRVQESFKLRIWISVSDHLDEAEIAKEIIEAVKKSPSNPMEFLVNNLTDFIAGNKINTNKNQMEMVLNSLTQIIKGKKILLVLDDVWTEDRSKWEPLKEALNHGGAGSKIIVTTRNESVAEAMGSVDNGIIHCLGQLSNTDSWAVMKRAALFGRSDAEDGRFHDIGGRIVGKCNGLPLAAKALGSLLHSKTSFVEWENVDVGRVWENDVFPHLLSSYNELSSTLKRCFSYCAVFPKGDEIGVVGLIECWNALGYLVSDVGHKGREFIDILAKHSLIQEVKKDELDDQIKSFKIHGIVHDFAEFIRKNSSTNITEEEEECEICHPLLVSRARDYRSIFLNHTPLLNLCPCLASTRLLRTNYRQQRIPQGIANLMIHLRWLDLSNSYLSEEEMRTVCKLHSLQTLLLSSCGLEEIPLEMAELIHLRHLNLMGNGFKELSEIICSLLELRYLNVSYCDSLCSLPRGINRLTKLENLIFEETKVEIFPEEVAELNSLNTLTEFRVGSGWNKWGMLKNLNHLSGSLKLRIKMTEDSAVEEIREAELKEKVNIQEQQIIFEDEMDDENESSMAMRSDVIGAMELNPNLHSLKMWFYKGSKFPLKLASNLNQLKQLHLFKFINLESLPPLGQLPCLEEIVFSGMDGLEIVGREFLGLEKKPADVCFPNLKTLKFYDCRRWEEWEDITAEEAAGVSIMPRLKKLHIMNCSELARLPYRLLLKVASMEELNLYGTDISVHSVRQSLSKNPDLKVTDDYS